jgi:hypothetical protein
LQRVAGGSSSRLTVAAPRNATQTGARLFGAAPMPAYFSDHKATGIFRCRSRGRGNVMRWKTLVAAPVLLLLTSCVIPIAIPVLVREDPTHYAARLEPPARYDHPYNGQVDERVMQEAQVRSLCMSMGADLGGVACSWQSNGTCHIVIPNDGGASVEAFRQHEIAHCNGWPANHPRD